MRKMLVSDYDGTFYINDFDFSLNKIELDLFKKDGNLFVIATGRSYFDFMNKLDKYNFYYDYLIINHGATILDNKGRIISNLFIPNFIISSLKESLELDKCTSYFCCSKLESRVSFEHPYLTKINVKYPSEAKAHNIYKKILEIYGEFITVYFVSPISLEIITKDTSKSQAIHKLISLVNISKSDVYTIGDGHSDIDMVRDFNGYSMPGGISELKKYAKGQISSVSDLMKMIRKQDDCLSFEYLLSSLNYYGISDPDYIKKCELCLKYLLNNRSILEKFKLFLYLFYSKQYTLKYFWNIKDINEMFNDKVDPFLLNLLLLCGYKFHIKNMENHLFDKSQIEIHRRRVREALTRDIYERGYDGIRITQMLWGIYFINCKLIEVGRLQYEYEDENTVNIHIPQGDKLDLSLVSDSINISKYYINRYFNITNYIYYCTSWLLSPEIHDLLDKDFNIYKFYYLFDVEAGSSCIKDILNFVYKKIGKVDYKQLSEDTRLQHIIKENLIKGKDFKIGKGILKPKN